MNVATSFASTLLLLFLFVLNLPAFTQAPVIEWQKCYGGGMGENLWSLQPTSDGGYIIAGNTDGPDNGDIMGYHGNQVVGDIWVAKLSHDGSIQWKKCLGGTFVETRPYIFQTADGGYVLAGAAESRDCSITGNHGGLDFWLVKLNEKGDLLWQKMYGGSKNEYVLAFNLTNDGGYMIAGLPESSDGDVNGNHGGRDYWVVKISGNGNIQWQKSLGGSRDEEAYSVLPTSDGGWIIAGFAESNDGDVTGNHGAKDYWIVKLSSTGNLLWQKCFGGAENDEARSMQLTKDGGYIVAGYTESRNGDVTGKHNANIPFRDYWIVKLDAIGNIQWQHCYGGDFHETAHYVNTTKDGGYVIIGSAESENGDLSCNAGMTDLWLIKISSTGALEWQKIIGGNAYDEGHFIKELNDGSFIIGGETCSDNISGFHTLISSAGSCADLWVIKLTAPGAIAPPPQISISPGSGIICSGVNTSFFAHVQYAGTSPTFQWRKNGMVVGSNSATFTSADLVNGDILNCTVTSGEQCSTVPPKQSTASVTIRTNAQIINPQLTITADNTVKCNCTTMTFEASVNNGGAAPIYQWLVNDFNTGFTGKTFVSNTLKAGDVIKCTYSDNSACVANGIAVSNLITIREEAPVSPEISISVLSNPVCEGSTMNFTAKPVNAGNIPGFQWKINGINAGNNQPEFSTASVKDGDIVTCTLQTDPTFTCATATTANSNPIRVNVTKGGIPMVSISTVSNTVCAGIPTTFTAVTTNSGANPNYQWTINGLSAGTNTNSFTSASLVNGDIINCSIIPDPYFQCALANSAASNSITMVVTATVPPSVTIAPSTNNVCEGTLLTFTASAENAGTLPSYRWSVNNIQTGNNQPNFATQILKNGDQVSCEMIPGKNSCTTTPVSSNTIVMAIKSQPAVSITPADTVVALGATVKLFASTSSALIADYTWSPKDQLQDPNSLQPNTLPLFENTRFTLEVQSTEGCSASATAVIHVAKKLIMPNAFSPNGDGTNDVFRIPASAPLKLGEFSIYDRWGRLLFTTSDISKGWDGTVKGVKVVSGVYAYLIKGANDKGNVVLKGTVLLIR